MAVEWPDVAEVMLLLDLGDSQAIEDHLQHALDAAIEGVKVDVGNWDEDEDAPDERLRQAALRAVQVLRVNAPDDGWRNLHADHIYQSLIYGHRRTFGVA
jgi:hypothetical protein